REGDDEPEQRAALVVRPERAHVAREGRGGARAGFDVCLQRPCTHGSEVRTGQSQRKSAASETGGDRACRVSAATAGGRLSKGAWECSAAVRPLQRNWSELGRM